MDPVTVALLVVVAVAAFVAGRGSVLWSRGSRRRLGRPAPGTWAEVEATPETPRPPLITPRTTEERIGSAVRLAIDGEVLRGRRQMAIRLYRESTGVPLVEAAAAIDAWQVSDGPRATSRTARPAAEPGTVSEPTSADGDTWPALPSSNRQPGGGPR